jgi:putative spermidine/putrescine transport system permease protein
MMLRAFKTPLWMIGPALLLLTLAFIAPLAMLLSRSIFDPTFTLAHYREILSNPQYLRVLWISVEIALVATLICLALGYPTAYALSRTHGVRRTLLLALILVPFWTNVLVRCYGWIIMLQTRGVINNLLVDQLGLLAQPLNLVFNFTGVMIGMVHYLLPPTILILDSVMKTVDPRLVVAAQSLGATRTQAFHRVFLPLTLPGIRAAGMLIFIMGLGFFVTPALLGGRRELTISSLISFEFTETISWGFGSALATLLLAITVIGLYCYHLLQPAKAGSSQTARGVHV